jgi:hypothetical protein
LKKYEKGKKQIKPEPTFIHLREKNFISRQNTNHLGFYMSLANQKTCEGSYEEMVVFNLQVCHDNLLLSWYLVPLELFLLEQSHVQN